MVAKIQVKVFWVVMPCSIAVGYQHFRGPCSVHLQGDFTYHNIPTQNSSTWIC